NQSLTSLPIRYDRVPCNGSISLRAGGGGDVVISGRPQPDEYADYAQADIDHVQGGDAVAALRDSARETLAIFEPLQDDAIAGKTYAPGKWTLKEILGHLIDDERIFEYRILSVARKESRPLPGFDENSYMAASSFESRTLESLLREYRIVRESTI